MKILKMSKNKMTLSSILKRGEKSNNTAIIMTDPLNHVHKIVTYAELIDRLDNVCKIQV